MNTQFQESLENLKGKTLDELCEEISVSSDWENDASEALKGWFAVITDIGIIAFFGNEAEALRFRLDYINRILNY